MGSLWGRKDLKQILKKGLLDLGIRLNSIKPLGIGLRHKI